MRAAALCIEALAAVDTGSALTLAAQASGMWLNLGPSPYGWIQFTPAEEIHAEMLLQNGDAAHALVLLDKAQSAGANRGRARALFLHASATAVVVSVHAACKEFQVLAQQLRFADKECDVATAVQVWLQ